MATARRVSFDAIWQKQLTSFLEEVALKNCMLDVVSLTNAMSDLPFRSRRLSSSEVSGDRLVLRLYRSRVRI